MVPTAAMLFGTLVHSMVLEPESVDALYLASPRFDRRTKAGKEALAEFEAQAEGKVVVDMDTFQRAQRTAEAVLTHPTAGPLFKGGNAEITARWEQHGLPCKARVDYYQGRSIVDLKTTQDASHPPSRNVDSQPEPYLYVVYVSAKMFSQEANV